MKSLTFILVLFLSFLVSCQPKTAVQTSNSMSTPSAPNEFVKKVSANNPENLRSQSKPSESPSGNVGSIVGNVESDSAGVCLKIQNPNLNVGDRVQIILTERPQEVLQAKVLEKRACEGESFGELSKDNLINYSLESTNERFLGRGFGLGVVKETPEARVVSGYAMLDINNDGKEEYFRDCTSNEGAHFTVWTGQPLKGKRIWHSYYHFNYDTEPSCKEKDYEGTNE